MRKIKMNQKIIETSSVLKLRLNGLPGQDILEQIVEGSMTFEQKTSFSQQKYLKKKKTKHLSLFSIEKPNTRIIFETYGNLRPEKCLGLRFETVCRILSYANIHAGSTVLVCETCAGLITRAVLERIGTDQAEGSVIQFYHGSVPPSLEAMLLPGSIYKQKVYPVSLLDVMPILLHKAFEDKNNQITETTGDDSESLAKISKVDDDIVSEEKEKITDQETVTKQVDTNARYISSFNHIFGSDRPSPDALVIITRFHPVDLTLTLLQFLPIGRPFVVYSQYIQPLVDLYNALKQRGGITHLRLTDTWFRRIQVLPDRTHPEINMSCTNGYLLNGYTVEPEISTKALLQSGLLSSVS
ncbi:unnamed protein product [Trichobilharzia szidati]|nr:unnamed protein product [Trichobilharzia szidati]